MDKWITAVNKNNLIEFRPPDPWFLIQNSDGTPLVSFWQDGHIEVMQGQQDEAARLFWQAIEAYGPIVQLRQEVADLRAENERLRKGLGAIKAGIGNHPTESLFPLVLRDIDQLLNQTSAIPPPEQIS